MMLDCKKIVRKDEGGFSLVELMIVVAIIGVLAAIAVPKFGTFQAKARQSEAKSNLSHIFTLEEAYYGDREVYFALAAPVGPGANNCNVGNPLGFQTKPCTTIALGGARYAYTTALAGAGWLATATAGANVIVPRCADADTYTINQDKAIIHTADAVSTCR
jgi:type IV pilus assembly protein PilA